MFFSISTQVFTYFGNFVLDYMAIMIKNLLFDLGGVIMDIRRQNCVDAFKSLGMVDPDLYLGEYCQAGPFEGIENGSYTIEQFHEAIRTIIGKDISDSDIDRAFGKFLIGIPLHRLEQLEILHKQLGIYMLSNTNPIMWADGIDSNFRKLGKDVNYYFDGIVRSYEAGVMKPNPKIFEIVISRFGINPEETIFLDDSEKNLEISRQLGFKTILVEPGTEFFQLLKSYPELHIN